MKINVNNTGINVQLQGSGELALVFLHYYGGSSRTWESVTGHLPDRYRTVAIDHRGWGLSDAPESGYRIEDLARDAEGVISALELKRYILVGHSMGGKVAQLMASRQPEGLEGLVLIAPSPPSPMLLSSEERDRLSSAYNSRESVGFVIDNVLTARPLRPALREQVIEDSLRASAGAKAGWPGVAISEDITREVASINVPVRVISGELDRVDTPQTLQRELLPRIPHAAMYIIPGTGHLSPLESPGEIASCISAFAASIEKSAAVYHSPGETIAAFDEAFNEGKIDNLMSVFSNRATMKMTDGAVIESNPEALRMALITLTASRPVIRNQIRTLISAGDLVLALIDWSLTTTSDDGTQRVEHGIATQVMEQGADKGWRIRISNPSGIV
ncbi:alpha/beta fold hydrolase [Pantoea sp. JZ29]|uniref:alpha/beta fold hydrolase n=1 Tax=Pantoea sp. JZ29 TaxID=2654192 RepID=UPI002B4A2CE8|nr:alpha/beta fold hydrolase [Pantoea sp. JZ29]WRH21359.1 alpha/beta fold hydrolase [Pantoea sp. JZ29]HBW7323383.1 alpha/beta fold hydrolase [Klebsiella pneumoniae]HBW7326958.1 alpha/beta fold hydrolase [Klebsiella pneumoniae]